MRKILWGLLLTFLIAMPVYGYTVVKGDTPYELWGANWKTELAKYGISDPRKLPVGLEVELNEGMLGATPTPTSSANRKYVESPDFYLYSPAVAYDTTITLNTLKDIYGNILTMTDLGTLGYGRIDPDSASISESITFSGITANSDGTYTLTGVKSALAKYPYTQTSGLKRSHSINAIFRLTNTAAFYDGFANKDNNEIVDGWWTFTSPTTSIFYTFPTVSSSAYTGLPTDNGQLATKYYVDTVGAGGFTAVNVSTNRGLSVDGSSPEKVGINASSTTGISFDGNGALYQAIGNALEYTGNAIAVSTSTIVSQIATSTPTANMVPIADGSGLIDTGFTNFYDFGSGVDGDIVFSVSTTITSTKYYNNITINDGVTIIPNGYKIYAKGTLLNNGVIAQVGVNGGNGASGVIGTQATGGIAGAAVPVSGTLAYADAGKAGSSGGYFSNTGGVNTAGVAGVAGYATTSITGSGAAGGASDGVYQNASGAGGAGGAATMEGCLFSSITSISTSSINYILPSLLATTTNARLSVRAGSGSGGGGAIQVYNNTGSNFVGAGAGGGSGSGGGIIYIQARKIINNGTMSVIGGNGGNGGNGAASGDGTAQRSAGGGGGGAGGSGGLIVLIYTSLEDNGNLLVTGGTGGTKGTAAAGSRDAGGAANGSNGFNGDIIKIKL